MSSKSDPPKQSGRYSDLLIRFGSAILLIGGQIAIIGAGHIAIFVEIFILQFVAIHEFTKISIQKSMEPSISFFIKKLPFIGTFVTSYLIAAPLLLRQYLPNSPLLRYHYFICFCIYALLIVIFVINLTPENGNYAFVRLSWTFIGCFVLIVPANLYVYVSYYSLFWFFTCVSLIAWNDTLAYFSGRTFGRHPLIALSPKKTVEGFVGALIGTLIVGWFQPLLFTKYPFTYCQGVAPYAFNTVCEIPPEFVLTTFEYNGKSITFYPAQLHSLILALFASLVAPFGGFLGSGLKRAYGLKDFGNLIPGHGGIIDRVDCQFVMAAFGVLYISTFLRY
ncbi:Phosphatidate cytidylyltransferase [Tritrichomonas foetus]|uniref:Phosphatidate cytidylyltransferase n=1 Tax=Tritrichomonas foetus TaxID=1144522 RepID=A0A1J4KKB3_9EUKA|nr:Phosphatidate cytidylyltransferase [Tritrichomonas foetus]|eukprot:OHT10118.1 Phosphatidate cytidylyltransferase [Tritrichomonas foetus]